MTEQTIFKKTSLAARWGLSTRTVDRRRDEGLLPQPEIFLGREPAWTLAAVEAAEAEMKRRAIEAPPNRLGTCEIIAKAREAAATPQARAKAVRTRAKKVAERKALSKQVRKVMKPVRKGRA